MRKILFLTSLLSVMVFADAFSQAAEKQGGPANAIVAFPATLNFNLGRGERGSQLLTLNNTTAQKYQLQLVTLDWTRDSIGNHSYLYGGSKQSCANWVTFDKSFVELEPGQMTTITVSMAVPDSAQAVSEMKWTMALLKTTEEKVVPKDNVKLAFATTRSMAIGIHVYQTPPNISNKQIKMVSFEAKPAENNIFRIRSKNTGGTQLSCKYTMELTSSVNGEKFTINSKVIPLFPNQDRIVDFEVPSNVPRGKYTVVAMIDAEDDEVPIEAVEREIVIK